MIGLPECPRGPVTYERPYCDVDYAMLVKLYGESPEAEKHYSPATRSCTWCRKSRLPRWRSTTTWSGRRINSRRATTRAGPIRLALNIEDRALADRLAALLANVPGLRLVGGNEFADVALVPPTGALGQQQSGGQSGQSAPTQVPTTGVFCIEEMTATFCNVPTGPNTGGYGVWSAYPPTGRATGIAVSLGHQAASGCSGPVNLLRFLFGQLHSSLNGGSLPHGGMDELIPPAPPLGPATPLDPDPVLDADTPNPRSGKVVGADDELAANT